MAVIHYDTADDPNHYTTRDGRILPVTGTHQPGVTTTSDGSPGTKYWLLDGVPCEVCEHGADSARVLPTRFPVGALIVWKYGPGSAHGTVIGHGRSRVEVFWHARRRPKPVRVSVARITGRGVRGVSFGGCESCKVGR
jgi:hypothetical protein